MKDLITLYGFEGYSAEVVILSWDRVISDAKGFVWHDKEAGLVKAEVTVGDVDIYLPNEDGKTFRKVTFSKRQILEIADKIKKIERRKGKPFNPHE